MASFVFGRHSAGNMLLSMAIREAGASVTKVLMVFLHMRLSVYTAHTFFTHQRKYIFPTIMTVWESIHTQQKRKDCKRTYMGRRRKV
jgi:hypothetical protein